MSKGARGIQSIEVSGRILHALVETGAPTMLKDLALAADITPAQCHAYLTSLKVVGLVHQDPQSGFYQTGPFAMRLGIGHLRSTPLLTEVMAKTAMLTESYDAIAAIAVWGPQGPTIVHVQRAILSSGLNVRQGTIFSVTGTATGRIFAAYETRPEIGAQIEAERNQLGQGQLIKDTLSQDEFCALVKAVQENGFATAEERPIPHINAISVPIFDNVGNLAFAATLIGASNTLPVDRNSEAVSKMMDLSKSVSPWPKAALARLSDQTCVAPSLMRGKAKA